MPAGALRARPVGWLLLLVFVTSLGVGCAASPLLDAVNSGDVAAAEAAIKSGADAEAGGWSDWDYPIDAAIRNNDAAMLALLHANGAKVRKAMVAEAAQLGAFDTYAYLAANGASLTHCITDVDYPNFWKLTGDIPEEMPALGSAIARDDYPSVVKLLQAGAPVEHRCNATFLAGEYEFSAIFMAAEMGTPEILNLLIRYGAPANRLWRGHTPVSIAAKHGNYEAVRILLAAGAYHSYTHELRQPIEYASNNGHTNVVHLLASAGAAMPDRYTAADFLQEVVDTAVAGAVIAGTVWVMAEGAKYAAYSDSYAATSASNYANPASNATSSTSNRSWKKSSLNRDECNSDVQCGSLQLCLKKPGHLGGICVRDVGLSRLKGERDAVGSAFPRPIKSRLPVSCPGGTNWDLIYQACTQ